MTEQGSHGGKITDHSERSFKGFLLPSLPFRQGLNCSEIIAVMSKGNLPQTEAGSSVAVAPGKAELLSFLKCQPGTGTGNGAVISCRTLTGCCPEQQRLAGSFKKPSVTCATAELEHSDLDKQKAVSPPQTLTPSETFYRKKQYLQISSKETSPSDGNPALCFCLSCREPRRKDKCQCLYQPKDHRGGCKPLLIRR